MGSAEDRRRENRERIRMWREWLTSFGEGADKKAKIIFVVGLSIAFYHMGRRVDRNGRQFMVGRC